MATRPSSRVACSCPSWRWPSCSAASPDASSLASGRRCRSWWLRFAVVVGLLMFALPGVEHGSYWTSFFPAMVVQGFGMALVITPLTTVALSSVEAEHSGLASGVNNVMARGAGLLAVAVVGLFAY